ncbi:hypothetical protein JOF53_000095 [Crossiella equi]|uniref:Uncharacterized protein n=1 Tax=Crossiella equi TaxID=130796 RepID=A0ABS5A3X2_9PSEU|nr:DUF6204 family protein [Crossiella equi]MBP2471223.1 hypothetical protein [Crossiella equi]
MTTPAFRVMVRGKFDALDEAQRTALDAVTGIGYAEGGRFTHDGNARVFTFRCQVPAEEDDDEGIAELKAAEVLAGHGLPTRGELKFSVTDMREIKIKRRGR